MQTALYVSFKHLLRYRKGPQFIAKSLDTVHREQRTEIYPQGCFERYKSTNNDRLSHSDKNSARLLDVISPTTPHVICRCNTSSSQKKVTNEYKLLALLQDSSSATRNSSG